MEKIVFVRNVTLVLSLIILVVLLVVYLMSPKLANGPAGGSEPEIQFVTDVRALSGAPTAVTESGFTLQLENLPPTMDNGLSLRTVSITPATIIEKTTPKTAAVYEAEFEAYQLAQFSHQKFEEAKNRTATIATSTRETLARLEKLSPELQALGTTSFNPVTNEMTYVIRATTTVLVNEIGSELIAPDPFEYTTATISDLTEDAAVTVFASENIYGAPSFVAERIIIR